MLLGLLNTAPRREGVEKLTSWASDQEQRNNPPSRDLSYCSLPVGTMSVFGAFLRACNTSVSCMNQMNLNRRSRIPLECDKANRGNPAGYSFSSYSLIRRADKFGHGYTQYQ